LEVLYGFTFQKPKGSGKKSLLPFKKKDSLSKTEQSVSSMCKQLKNSIVKDCFIDLFRKEQEENINVLPKKLSPYLNNLSIGEIKLCEDTTHLIDINYFKEKLAKCAVNPRPIGRGYKALKNNVFY
jgi:hypothetical protein